MNYSLSFSGILLMLIGWLVKALDLNVGSEEVQTTVNVLLVIGGALAALYGRWRAGGLTWSGFRK